MYSHLIIKPHPSKKCWARQIQASTLCVTARAKVPAKGELSSMYLLVVGPSQSSAQLGSALFWLELLGKKARLSSALHAFQKAQLGSDRHILQKKLG